MFPIVPAVGAPDAPLAADVVPTTPPILIPAGWNVIIRATVYYLSQGTLNVDPTPVPPGGQIYGGGTLVIVREDGATARASAATFEAFETFSPDGVAVQWNAGGEIVAVGQFVSDGAPHTYVVQFASPRFVGVTQFATGTPNVAVGLEIFATPP